VLKKLILVAITVVAGLSGTALSSNAAHLTPMHLEPNLILIGASYNGAHVSLSGEAPQDAEVMVRLSGEMEDDTFLEKGHVLGILWMNKKMITFHHIPKTYQVYSPSSITGSELSDDPKWRNLGIGFSALKKQLTLTPEEEDVDLQFREFLKLKTMEGLYAVHENAITYKNVGEGIKSFQCDLTIPCAIPQGSYTVTTFILKDGEILKADNQQLKIKETGLPTIISSLAFNHSVLYGILATLIAIVAGLVMGAFFKKAGAH
jgi:uncharacterized protein (TIGR02186 family)